MIKYKRIVISLSGSFVNSKALKKFSKIFSFISKKCEILCVVVGGGEAARKYISLAKELGLSEKEQDLIGIAVTRVNALLLSLLLRQNNKIPETYEEVVNLLKKNKFIVCAGIKPGQSTDKVAADIASLVKADILINITKVEGVYDRDPSEPGAKMLKRISYDELKKILARTPQKPGKYALFDLKAIDVVKEKRIPVRIISGKDPKNILNVLKDTELGTLVT